MGGLSPRAGQDWAGLGREQPLQTQEKLCNLGQAVSLSGPRAIIKTALLTPGDCCGVQCERDL